MELIAVCAELTDTMALKYLALTLGVIVLIGVGAYATLILGGGAAGQSTSQSSSSTASAQGSFTYSPSYPVRVESVSASTYAGGNGTMVSFAVTFENVGPTDIYSVAGCGSSLVATLPPSSGVLRQVTGGPVCLCAEAPMAVHPGGNRTSVTPGCWTVYKFLLVHSGTVLVHLTLYWGQTQSSSQQNTTDIAASFTFS